MSALLSIRARCSRATTSPRCSTRRRSSRRATSRGPRTSRHSTSICPTSPGAREYPDEGGQSGPDRRSPEISDRDQARRQAAPGDGPLKWLTDTVASHPLPASARSTEFSRKDSDEAQWTKNLSVDVPNLVLNIDLPGIGSGDLSHRPGRGANELLRRAVWSLIDRSPPAPPPMIELSTADPAGPDCGQARRRREREAADLSPAHDAHVGSAAPRQPRSASQGVEFRDPAGCERRRSADVPHARDRIALAESLDLKGGCESSDRIRDYPRRGQRPVIYRGYPRLEADIFSRRATP